MPLRSSLGTQGDWRGGRYAVGQMVQVGAPLPLLLLLLSAVVVVLLASEHRTFACSASTCGRLACTCGLSYVLSRFQKMRTTKGKLKYVPGPVGALIDQAAIVGLNLVINSDNELEFQREGRGPIPLIGWNRKAWKQEVKRHINDDLLRELHEAVALAHDNEGN